VQQPKWIEDNISWRLVMSIHQRYPLYPKLANDKKHIDRDIHLIDPKAWDTHWNVNIAPVGSVQGIKRLNIFTNMSLKWPYS
jgi:hypothetical protein